MTENKLINPYFEIEKANQDIARINTVVPADTIETLMSIHPRPPGVIKNTVNIIYAKLIAELKRRGITSFAQQSDFLNFMRDCQIGLPGERLGGSTAGPAVGSVSNGTTPGAVPQAAEPSDGRGAASVNNPSERATGQPSPVQQPSPTRQGGGQGKRKGVAESRSV